MLNIKLVNYELWDSGFMRNGSLGIQKYIKVDEELWRWQAGSGPKQLWMQCSDGVGWTVVVKQYGVGVGLLMV